MWPKRLRAPEQLRPAIGECYGLYYAMLMGYSPPPLVEDGRHCRRLCGVRGKPGRRASPWRPHKRTEAWDRAAV